MPAKQIGPKTKPGKARNGRPTFLGRFDVTASPP